VVSTDEKTGILIRRRKHPSKPARPGLPLVKKDGMPEIAEKLYLQLKREFNVYYDDGGLDPHYKQLYFDKYAQLDPFTTGHVLAEVGEPISTIDILSFEEFHATRFHREWARPQGLVDFACAVIEKSTTSVAMVGIFRHERDGIVNDETRRAMRLIVPHIRRAVLIGQVADLKSMEATTLADTLNGLSAGVFLVDENDRLIHANESGRSMLDMRDVLHLANGRLAARNTSSQKALREVFGAAGSGDRAVGTKGISIPLTARDGERYVAHVLPLTSGMRRRAGTRGSRTPPAARAPTCCGPGSRAAACRTARPCRPTPTTTSSCTWTCPPTRTCSTGSSTKPRRRR